MSKLQYSLVNPDTTYNDYITLLSSGAFTQIANFVNKYGNKDDDESLKKYGKLVVDAMKIIRNSIDDIYDSMKGDDFNKTADLVQDTMNEIMMMGE